VAAEHRPYFAQLNRRDSDSLPSEVDQVRALIESPGWALVNELVDVAHGDAVRRLLFTHTGATGRVLDQAEYARLLGFLSGLGQARVAAEALLMHAERAQSTEE
jgi:hypothetical protein